jgi:hypothetical protein
MSNRMPKEKAVKIMKDYAKNNFNAYKTLKENGYSESTANKQPSYPINNAKKVVANALDLDPNRSVKDVSSDVFALIGISREDIIKELVKVIKQDKDLTNKLKALTPALKHLNYDITNSEDTVKPQPITITLEETVKTIDVTPNN